jgi:hypothetical protein
LSDPAVAAQYLEEVGKILVPVIETLAVKEQISVDAVCEVVHAFNGTAK